jgi:large subunit ribosomal protein L18
MTGRMTPVERRKKRTRYQIKKAAKGKPRLSIFRSSNNMHAQIIDDVKGVTIAAASTIDKELKGKLKSTSNKEAAAAVGKLIAKRALEKKVVEVVFDRGAFLYHGRVKSLAEAAREAGLKF